MSDPIKVITRFIRQRCGGLADLSVERGDSDRWQSLLFDGGRHHIALRLDGDRVEEAIGLLRDEAAAPDLIIPGHLLVDISITGVDRSLGGALVRLEALTIVH
jgi:hypothetical protein